MRPIVYAVIAVLSVVLFMWGEPIGKSWRAYGYLLGGAGLIGALFIVDTRLSRLQRAVAEWQTLIIPAAWVGVLWWFDRYDPIKLETGPFYRFASELIPFLMLALVLETRPQVHERSGDAVVAFISAIALLGVGVYASIAAQLGYGSENSFELVVASLSAGFVAVFVRALIVYLPEEKVSHKESE